MLFVSEPAPAPRDDDDVEVDDVDEGVGELRTGLVGVEEMADILCAEGPQIARLAKQTSM